MGADARLGRGADRAGGDAVSLRLKCTGCKVDASVESRYEAAKAGWAFVEIAAQSKALYHCLCPECAKVTRWLAASLGEDKPKKGKPDA